MGTTMQDVLERIRGIQADLAKERERDRAAILHAAKLANENWQREFDARVQAGLIDREKVANYVTDHPITRRSCGPAEFL